MRAYLIGLMALAATAGAQDGSAAAPPAPKGPTRAEFRVGGFMVSGDRSFDVSNNVTTTTGLITGVDVLLRASGIGLSFRSLSGTFGSRQVISADARILLFPPAFTIQGGVGKRAISSDLGTNIRDIAILGVSSTVNIGGTGLRTHIGVTALASPDKDPAGGAGGAAEKASTGLEGEAAILYRLPRAPIFVSLGYRTEIFTSKSSSLTAPEEVRGIRLGGGIQFGGR